MNEFVSRVTAGGHHAEDSRESFADSGERFPEILELLNVDCVGLRHDANYELGGGVHQRFGFGCGQVALGEDKIFPSASAMLLHLYPIRAVEASQFAPARKERFPQSFDAVLEMEDVAKRIRYAA